MICSGLCSQTFVVAQLSQDFDFGLEKKTFNFSRCLLSRHQYNCVYVCVYIVYRIRFAVVSLIGSQAVSIVWPCRHFSANFIVELGPSMQIEAVMIIFVPFRNSPFAVRSSQLILCIE